MEQLKRSLATHEQKLRETDQPILQNLIRKSIETIKKRIKQGMPKKPKVDEKSLEIENIVGKDVWVVDFNDATKQLEVQQGVIGQKNPEQARKLREKEVWDVTFPKAGDNYPYAYARHEMFFSEAEAVRDYKEQKKIRDARTLKKKSQYNEESEGFTSEEEEENNKSDSELEGEVHVDSGLVVPEQPAGKRVRSQTIHFKADDFRLKKRKPASEQKCSFYFVHLLNSFFLCLFVPTRHHFVLQFLRARKASVLRCSFLFVPTRHHLLFIILLLLLLLCLSTSQSFILKCLFFLVDDRLVDLRGSLLYLHLASDVSFAFSLLHSISNQVKGRGRIIFSLAFFSSIVTLKRGVGVLTRNITTQMAQSGVCAQGAGCKI